MHSDQLPSVLVSAEFLAQIRTDINFSKITHKSTRKKAERFARAMIILALDSLQYSLSSNHYVITVEVPTTKLAKLVGKNSTGEFYQVIWNCRWEVDHRYSTGIGNTKQESKKIGIPVAVHRRMYEFLKENGAGRQRAQTLDTVETSWTKKAIDPCRKDGKQRYHSFQLPNAVRVNIKMLQEYVDEMDHCKHMNVSEKLKARTLFELAAENDGWINQYYREVLSGRVYGRGMGNLQLAKNELLDQMLAGCWQLDIQAAAQTLIPQICRKIMNDESLEFDGLEEYAVNRKCLRKQWAEEVGCSVDAIKETVTALLYGSSVAAKEMVVDGRRTLSAIRKILKTEDAVNRFRSVGGVKKMENDTRRAFKLVTTGLMQNGMLEEFGLDKIWMDQATKSEILAMCYQRTESRILAVMVTELQDQVVISKHDGLIILERLVQVDDLENKIFDQTGYRIRLDQDLVGGA